MSPSREVSGLCRRWPLMTFTTKSRLLGVKLRTQRRRDEQLPADVRVRNFNNVWPDAHSFSHTTVSVILKHTTSQRSLPMDRNAWKESKLPAGGSREPHKGFIQPLWNSLSLSSSSSDDEELSEAVMLLFYHCSKILFFYEQNSEQTDRKHSAGQNKHNKYKIKRERDLKVSK